MFPSVEKHGDQSYQSLLELPLLEERRFLLRLAHDVKHSPCYIPYNVLCQHHVPPSLLSLRANFKRPAHLYLILISQLSYHPIIIVEFAAHGPVILFSVYLQVTCMEHI